MQSLPHVPPALPIDAVTPSILRFRDACNVYVLRSGRDGVLVDAGTGAVFDHLEALGVARITDVLVTHHHRDGTQGLARAAAEGARIWVPPVERRLIERADEHWAQRQLENDYDLRQDRFSPLASVPVSGAVAEYRTQRFGDHDVLTLPTPGHTPGSVTYLVLSHDWLLAFCGDLLYGDGQLQSLAATQWSYTGAEGLLATNVSCAVLADREPDVLLPAHGPTVVDPPLAFAGVRSRTQELADLRLDSPWDLDDMYRQPWAPVTPHLLRNRASFANSYALVSETGGALLIDAGYDVTTGLVPSTQFEARRALLWPLDALRRDHGVERIEAIVLTHFHDDHVAGVDLVRDVEGAELWSPANVAPIVADPRRYDLPCLWFEPLPSDRVLALGETVRWHEYELTVHELPGHTLFAAAIEFEVDGKRVLATGDQQSGGNEPVLNYQYRNRFRIDDYVASAALYRRLRPDVLVTGHWPPQDVTPELLDRLESDGARLAELHRALLPNDVDVGVGGFAARIEPYRPAVAAGESIGFDVWVRNPFDRPEPAAVRLHVPAGWAEPAMQQIELGPHGEATLRFDVLVPHATRRARVAAELTVGGRPLGQQAEALVDAS